MRPCRSGISINRYRSRSRNLLHSEPASSLGSNMSQAGVPRLCHSWRKQEIVTRVRAASADAYLPARLGLAAQAPPRWRGFRSCAAMVWDVLKWSCGARSRDRTGKGLLPADFKSAASTDFAIRAAAAVGQLTPRARRQRATVPLPSCVMQAQLSKGQDRPEVAINPTVAVAGPVPAAQAAGASAGGVCPTGAGCRGSSNAAAVPAPSPGSSTTLPP